MVVRKNKKFGCEVYNIKLIITKLVLCMIVLFFFKSINTFSIKNNSILLNFTIKPLIYGTLVSRILNIPTICMITGLGTVFIDKNFITNIVIILYKISFKK